MADPPAFGISGLELKPGDHVCALYIGQSERDDMLLPYLRSGQFSTDDMLTFWDVSVGAAVSGGRFRFTRVAGEMLYALRDQPDREQFMRYEPELNRFVPRYPQAVLCMYDLGRFGGGFLVDLLKTHPKLLLGGMVLDNPHYLPPDQFLATRQ